LINPDIFTEDFVRLLAGSYGISIIALVFCYVCYQSVNHESTIRQRILSQFEKVLNLNLLVTVGLMVLVMYPHSVGSFLILFMAISITSNMVIPSIFGIFFFLILLYDFVLSTSKKFKVFFHDPKNVFKR